MENINENIEIGGSINISDEVIATIASVAVSETKGVYDLASSFANDIVSKISKKPSNKGIKVSKTNDDVIIDISLVMEYGVRIPEIAWEVQENVKKSVESMSGLNVEKVNIHIAGINFDSEKSETVTESEE